MPALPPPPVPQGIRELLKDYPDHIRRLQEALSDYVQKPFRVMPLDGAIWALEGRLETFASEARKELKQVKASGDGQDIARAEEKEILMLHAGSVSQYDLSELRAYFDAHREMLS
jgi:hypothetical protein